MYSSMYIQPLEIFDVKLLTPKKFGDDRGYFMETFRQDIFNKFIGKNIIFVQDNHSLSAPGNTLRGLHFQAPPHAQGKLVRCIRGSMTDVAVDARKSSPTYGHHVSVKLSADNAQQLWVPKGFLHGFVTLEPNTEVVYKVTDYYSPDCDGNVSWNDPDLAIDWGISEDSVILSDKDAKAQTFSDFKTPFA